MNQIITQHGWCLNSNMWLNLKNKLKKDNLLWQDNERGYFYSKSKNPEWIENNNKNNFRMVICHSLGTQLINPNILNKASHAVLINSFFNFIPNNNRRNFTIRVLRKMEKRINSKEIEFLIKEFLFSAFLPNPIEDYLKDMLKIKNKEINLNLLLNDFKRLYCENLDYRLFSKDCEILIIKSNNDSILEENSIINLISILNKIQNKKPKVVELDQQGHLIIGNEILNIIKEWIN
ncbi:MAG: hypothetical protein CMK49_03890 [Prochlorococcus sp. SP3034]|nr:hypothetical protein [Prochlorococcus sp. SP3034]|tara:strand:- start:6585 stop:7286 length:702 start_codon:yes stop_codon:yes gene_type:complete